jgi:hypothetical protein
VAGDLNLDPAAISALGDALGRLRGQWEGSAVTLDPPLGLGGDEPLTGTLGEFTTAWAKAATSIDTFVAALAAMCHGVGQGFHDTDIALAQGAQRVHGHLLAD